MMRSSVCLFMILLSGALMAAQLKVDVNTMPRIVFTGDSQTCGCVGAMDYPQMLSPEIPLRVFNRAVGGSNTTHLLDEFGGGTVTVKAGEKIVHGTDVSWYAGPYIGQTVRIGTQQYTVDCIKTLDYAKRICELTLTEPAREDYAGTDIRFEPGWRIRVADVKPRYACFMFTVNDPGWKSPEFKARLAEITKRCREAGIQPIFLSGVPFMDAASGGSHGGSVEANKIRPQDMLEFCQEQRLPFGDVYRMLDWLDPQRTSVWVDTIHPTNDGSILAIHALRHMLKELGALDNPYYVHGFRAPEHTLPRPSDARLIPIATAQPRRDKDNKENQAGHDLEAQRLRDEYGLIATEDGQSLTSATGVMFQIGVGPREQLEGFDVDVTCSAPATAQVYHWRKRAWVSLRRNEAKLGDCVHEGALWVGVPGPNVTVDYIGVTLRGTMRPWQSPQSDRAILWPAPGEFDWTPDNNLFPNGALAQAEGDGPAGWVHEGDGAPYLREGAVATGTGEFAGPRLDQLKCAGAKFTQMARTLDMVVIQAEVPDGPNFLIAQVLDDETLQLRRSVKTAPGPVGFEVRRWSGLKAVPGGCCVEVTPGSQWETWVALPKGEYRFGFFYRAFDPAAMGATATPQGRPAVALDAPTFRDPIVVGPDLDTSFLWLRGWQDVTLKDDGKLRVRLGVEGRGAMQYTGFSLQKR